MRIVSTGMTCSVGHTADASCAAIRAGIAGFAELPYRIDPSQPIVGAPMPWFEFARPQVDRLTEMLAYSVAECLEKAPGVSTQGLALLVGLAEPERPGGGAALARGIVLRLEELLGTKFHPRCSGVVATGHTSTIEALVLARQHLAQPGIEACLVCAVDSYVNARSLSWLCDTQRLKSDDNSDGVIPGEAAAAVLLHADSKISGPEDVRVTGLGVGHELAGVLTQEPLLGHGLADAARKALKEADKGLHEIAFRVSDLAGESYSFREQALMLARVMRSRREDFPLWHCAESIGDTGAAAGACALVAAHRAFVRRYAPGDSAICFASSVQGRRAAAILQYGPK